MSYEEQDVIWRVALASYDPREMRVWTRYLEERNPAIRCTGYRSSRPLLERLEQGDVDVLVLGGRLEDMDSIQFLPRIRGLARKPLVLLRDDGRNEKSAVESLSQEDACYLIRQATLEDMLQELRAPAGRRHPGAGGVPAGLLRGHPAGNGTPLRRGERHPRSAVRKPGGTGDPSAAEILNETKRHLQCGRDGAAQMPLLCVRDREESGKIDRR